MSKGKRKRATRRVDSKDLGVASSSSSADDLTQLNGSANGHAVGTQANGDGQTQAQPKVSSHSKHKHLRAIHARSTPSCLSYQDTSSAPDFWGFRNILILLLSE